MSDESVDGNFATTKPIRRSVLHNVDIIEFKIKIDVLLFWGSSTCTCIKLTISPWYT